SAKTAAYIRQTGYAPVSDGVIHIAFSINAGGEADHSTRRTRSMRRQLKESQDARITVARAAVHIGCSHHAGPPGCARERSRVRRKQSSAACGGDAGRRAIGEGHTAQAQR